jgi:RNA polymerase sigma-70 factor (ECF subfamily)
MNGTAIVMGRTAQEPHGDEQRPRFPRPALDRDAALVAQLRRADAGAAEALVGAYGDRVYRLALRITGHVSDAEEVVQDALWTVVRKIDTFRGESAFGSWLYRIAANAAYQKVRGRRRRPEVPLDDVLPSFHDDGQHAASIVDWSPTVDDPSRQADLRFALTAAIDALPEDYRAAVVLRDVEEFSIAEVAEMLGLSVANAKTRVHRARLFLRRRLAVSMATNVSPTLATRGGRAAPSPPVDRQCRSRR